MLLRQARSGSAGQAPMTTPASAQAAVGQRLEGQRGVVERAERRVDDDEHGGVEPAGQVGDRRALVVVPHEQPAGALDDDEVAVVGKRPDPRSDLAAGRAAARPAATGCGGGGQRVG